MKFLIILGMLMFIGVAYGADFKCIEGVPLEENECNPCECYGGKHFSCTKLYCPFVQHLRECKVGTSWMKDCNRCCCVQGFGTICEDRKCSDGLVAQNGKNSGEGGLGDSN